MAPYADCQLSVSSLSGLTPHVRFKSSRHFMQVVGRAHEQTGEAPIFSSGMCQLLPVMLQCHERSKSARKTHHQAKTCNAILGQDV
mgnify:CR=1 FL=1